MSNIRNEHEAIEHGTSMSVERKAHGQLSEIDLIPRIRRVHHGETQETISSGGLDIANKQHVKAKTDRRPIVVDRTATTCRSSFEDLYRHFSGGNQQVGANVETHRQ